MKAQYKLVRFLLKYPDEWHSFASDKETAGIVCATSNLGILEVNEFNQMKLKSEEKALTFISYQSIGV